MPQKKNPDALELIRGRAGRLQGNLAGMLAVMKSAPTTYNKDFQVLVRALRCPWPCAALCSLHSCGHVQQPQLAASAKELGLSCLICSWQPVRTPVTMAPESAACLQEAWEALFDSVDTLNACVRIATGVISTIKINPARMRSGLSADMLATDLAEYLVRKGKLCLLRCCQGRGCYMCHWLPVAPSCRNKASDLTEDILHALKPESACAGVPFRETHHISGAAVKMAEDRGCTLADLSPSDLRTIHPQFEGAAHTCGQLCLSAFRMVQVDSQSMMCTLYQQLRPTPHGVWGCR